NYSKSGLGDEGYSGLPIVVVHDELDFEPGVVRVKTGGSAGGHNGVADIIRQVSSKDFLRVRIGVGHPRHYSLGDYSRGSSGGEDNRERPQMSVSDWVLSSPKGEEFDKIESGVERAASVIIQLLKRGVHSVKY